MQALPSSIERNEACGFQCLLTGTMAVPGSCSITAVSRFRRRSWFLLWSSLLCGSTQMVLLFYMFHKKVLSKVTTACSSENDMPLTRTFCLPIQVYLYAQVARSI